ncbi:IclR family transcriptional regulator [Pseudoroseomonas cervicalis]|uniref:IclR family transcriptional regulator n=1 Tax=Teichococcus cervicalis TaxID=204525 RepID=UPI0022F1D808|nr:IclR family transcriptional regulator [Pseudoroseomonas cervicalis]WBV43409.1 IclR family transcriptional regulator [Pseudoroseomonas cervicalis]
MPRRRATPPETDTPGADRHFVTALARGLEVLGCFRRGEALLGNQDIASRTGLPKSTVSRLTHTLTELGYLHYVPELGRYRLGMAVLSMGSAMLAGLDIRRLARPLLQALATETRSIVALGARDRMRMIYLELARGDAAVAVNLEAGSRISLATSAMGRAWLAACPPAQRDALLRGAAPEAQARLRATLERALAEQAEYGCCCSFGDWQEDVNAIALGFDPGGGLPPMVVNCGAPSFLVSPEYLLQEARPRLQGVVRKLSHCMDLAAALPG